jgi:hypothetical protein
MITLDENIIYTKKGIHALLTTQIQNRIGDVIHSKGITLKLAVECTFRIFVVKSAKGDRPTDGSASTLVVSATGNNMMDNINYCRSKGGATERRSKGGAARAPMA